MIGDSADFALAARLALACVTMTNTVSGAGPSSPRALSERLISELDDQPLAYWLDAGRARVLASDVAGAAAIFEAAVARFPFDAELWLAVAGIRTQRGDKADAEALLRDLLEHVPGHAAAAFALARLLAEQQSWSAAEAVLVGAFARFPPPTDLALRAAKMLADWGRKSASVEIGEAAIAAGSADAMLMLYVAALQGQLGAFERARQLYQTAIDRDSRTLDFGAAYGLASITRYADRAHPDLERFRRLLERPGLDARVRASLLFALGKIHDDLGDFAQAAALLREANALVDGSGWSRKHWRRLVDARLGGRALPQRTPPAGECVPIFIVGAPRSGTTLAAELLGRSPLVRNRGELDWLPHYAGEVAAAAKPDRPLLDRIAADYLARLCQEDTETRWFIDKQPLNFLHADLIRALFPQAAIIHCRRSSRDTALSIWSQHFGSAEYRFAYDFDDIAMVLQGCSKLMAKAARVPGSRVFELRYEELVREPQRIIDALAYWLGLPRFDCSKGVAARDAIGTASLWQARQPVYTRAIGRWQAYAEFVPELTKLADD